jgi:hypothetical protein
MRLQRVLFDHWHANTGCLVAQDLAMLTKVRTLIHEEISLLTVLYFPFRARTGFTAKKRNRPGVQKNDPDRVKMRFTLRS